MQPASSMAEMEQDCTIDHCTIDHCSGMNNLLNAKLKLMQSNTPALWYHKLYGANIMTKQFEFELCKFELLTSVI